jgi:membrane protein DedA with SNARE-associated domain
MIYQIMEFLSAFCIDVISTIGYPGIFFLMVLESMVVPIPSELVMPFAGFLISRGDFSFLFVIVASSLGSIVGSLISYYMGKYGGNRLVMRYGKYLLLDAADLLKTEEWFNKRGEYTIFISRFIPVVRHLISIPAGIGNMNLKRFIIFTITGASLWNFTLTYAGYLLGKNWGKIEQYTEPFSIAVAVLLLLGLIFTIYRHIRHKKLINKHVD